MTHLNKSVRLQEGMPKSCEVMYDITISKFIIFTHKINKNSALEPNTLIVRDTQEYWALGWPTSISCDSKSKLEDINSGEVSILKHF